MEKKVLSINHKKVFKETTARLAKEYCRYVVRAVIKPALSRYKWKLDYGMGSAVLINSNDKQISWRTKAARNLEEACDKALKGTALEEDSYWSVWTIVNHAEIDGLSGIIYWNTKID